MLEHQRVARSILVQTPTRVVRKEGFRLLFARPFCLFDAAGSFRLFHFLIMKRWEEQKKKKKPKAEGKTVWIPYFHRPKLVKHYLESYVSEKAMLARYNCSY